MTGRQLFFHCMLLCIGAHAQNRVPSISDVSIQTDPQAKRLTISYKAFDADNDIIIVLCKAAGLNGATILIDSVIIPPGGPLHTIVWDYATVNDTHIDLQLVADDRQPVAVSTLVNATDSSRIRELLLQIGGVRDDAAGIRHKEAVKALLEKCFKENGLQVQQQHFTWPGNAGCNIIGHWQGLKEGNIRYVLTAHYDTVNDSPGADDNGSGVAGLLEAMTILSKYHFRNSIDFVLFDQEEPGLIGSEYYLSSMQKQDHMRGAFNFDMIGYYTNKVASQQIPPAFANAFPQECKSVEQDSSRGNFVLSVADSDSRSLSACFSQSIKKYVPALRSVVLIAAPAIVQALPELTASDHASFWKYGYKAVHIGDTGPARNPFYHSGQDVIATINCGFINNIVKATIACLAELAQIQHVSIYTTSVDLP